MIEVSKVAEHYKGSDLMNNLLAALKSAGLEEGPLTIEQLAPLDQFHSRGLAATIELAKVLNPSPTTRILDIGSGLGGPSRYLAATYGCSVTGIDLSESFVEAATYLAQRAALDGKVSYQRANALSLPFGPEEFDVAWTQHVAMNIADRETFYSEAHRVLKPGGRIAIYDVLAGIGDLIFPVPWSPSAETSFLLSPDEMREMLTRHGFNVTSWVDRSQAATEWFAARHKSQASQSTPPLGLHLAMGPDFKMMTGNLARNLANGSAVLLEATAART